MNKYIIDELIKIRNGSDYTVYNTKDINDSELNTILENLYNLGVLNKINGKYSVKNISHLSKIIKLKSIDKYIVWCQKEKIPKDRKIHLFFYIVFGIITAYFLFLNYSLYQKNDVLKSQFDSLKIEYEIYKDSVVLLNTKLKQNTMQAKGDTLISKN